MQIRTMGRTFQRLAMIATGVCTLATVLSVGGVPASGSATDAKSANPSEATALVAAAGPATARAASTGGTSDASLLADCPADSLCIFQHRDFLGELLVTPAGTSRIDLRGPTCIDRAFKSRPCEARRKPHGTWSDQMSSWVNNTSLNYCWYFDINYGSPFPFPVEFPMPAGQSVSYLPQASNDEASSLRPC